MESMEGEETRSMVLLPTDMFKFNVDGAAREKPSPAGIGVLHNGKGEVLCMFSKHVGVRDFNEAEVLAVFEALIGFFGHLLGID